MATVIQTIFGRDKQTGAPLGMQHEHDVPDYASDPEGKVIALDSHIRLANPRTAESESSLMLRRGYSYSLGGRDKQTGAPLGMLHEHDVPDYASDPEGKVIALDSHIRLANPRTAESVSSLMLRRGYSYSLGVTNSGQLDRGLLFVCYQHDLEKGFLTVQ